MPMPCRRFLVIERPTFGDRVKVRMGAPVTLRPGETAWVCGFRNGPFPAESTESSQLGHGTKRIYLVEYSDGFSTEIAEELLENL